MPVPGIRSSVQPLRGTLAALNSNIASLEPDELVLATDTGDIYRVVAGSPQTLQLLSGVGSITAGSITYDKIQNVSAQYIALGRISAGAGVPEELTPNNLVTFLGQATTRTGSGSVVLNGSPTLGTPLLNQPTYNTFFTANAGVDTQNSASIFPDFVLITSTPNNPSGVTLASNNQQAIFVANRGTNPVNIYPPTGCKIDGLLNNVPIQLAVGQSVSFWRVNSTLHTNSYVAGALQAGTTTLAPLVFATGTNTTTAQAGAFEYDGSFFYVTPEIASSGRGNLPVLQTFRLTANGAAIGPAIANFFGASGSAINLAANSVYDLEFYAYLTKTTAGTLTWTLTASSAPTMLSGFYHGSPVTGIAAGTPITGIAGAQNSTTAAFPATASLTTAVNHWYHFKVQVVTNLATTLTLRATSSAGTVTPLAGSFFSVRRVSGTVGTYT